MSDKSASRGRMKNWLKQGKSIFLPSPSTTRSLLGSSPVNPTLAFSESLPAATPVSTLEVFASVPSISAASSNSGSLSQPITSTTPTPITGALSTATDIGNVSSQAPVFSTPPPPALSSKSLAAGTTKYNDHLPQDRLGKVLRVLRTTSKVFPPLESAIAQLLDCLDLFENSRNSRQDYDELAADLEASVVSLNRHLPTIVTGKISDSMKSVMQAIQNQINRISRQGNNGGARHLEVVTRDEDELVRCYRRLGMLFSQLQVDISLSTWSIANEQLANSRLQELDPAKEARYNSAQSTDVKRRTCTENTRTELLATIRGWTQQPDGPKIYWMNGMAGTGKTTIACTISSELEANTRLGASFFCSRTLPNCRDIRRIIPTIAYQLARFSYPFQSQLCDILGNDPDASTRDVATQFHKLVREPLLRVKEAVPDDLVVVIDALDECNDLHSARLVLKMLFHHAADLPIKFFVTSRPEHGLYDEVMSQDNRARSIFHLHEIESSLVEADIEIYLEAELGSLSLPANQMKRLAEQSKSFFIYAATAVQYIRPENARVNHRKRLSAILEMTSGGLNKHQQTIDGLYMAILEAALGNPSLELAEIDNIKLILWTTICAQEPLDATSLAELLRLDDDQEVLLALEPLRSVLHISEYTGHVSTLHASFPDFMMNRDRSGQFTCDKTIHNGLLAQRCFELMKDRLHFNMCSLRSSFIPDNKVSNISQLIEKAISPAIFYACRYWGDHLELAAATGLLVISLREFMTSRFLPWTEVLNLKGSTNKGGPILQKAQKWLQGASATPDEYQRVHDAWKFVTTFAASSASISTPHIYLSALAFWHPRTPTSEQYGVSMLAAINIDRTIIERTDAAHLATWNTGFVVSTIAFSPDSSYVVSGSGDHAVRIWDAHTGTVIAGPLRGHTHTINSVAFSPNGKRVASGSNDGTIRVWDASTGNLVAKLFEKPIGRISSVAFSPDGTRIVSCSEHSIIRVWDAHNPVTTQPLRVDIPQFGGVPVSVSFSPDGAHVLSNTYSRIIHVRNVQTDNVIVNSKPFDPPAMTVHSTGVSADGTRMATGSTDGTISIWDVLTCERVAGPFAGHTATVTSVQFSPDGAYIVSGSYDSTVHVLDALNGSAVAGPFKEHTEGVRSVAFSPDGTRVISSSDDGTIRVWDVHNYSKTPVGELSRRHTHQVNLVRFSLDGTRIFSWYEDRNVYVWGMLTGKVIAGPVRGGSLAAAAFLSDRTLVVFNTDDHQVQTWNVETGDIAVQRLEGHSAWVMSAAFSPDVTRIVAGFGDGAICIWNVLTGSTLTGPIMGHARWVVSVVFSHDGAYVASGSTDCTVSVWDASDGTRIAGPFEGHTDEVQSVAFSPDGTRIVSGSADSTVRVWSLTGGKVAGPFKGHTGHVNSVEFSPDSTLVVSGSNDCTVCVWDASHGEVIAGPFEGHTARVKSVAFSPDGTRIVSGSADCTIRVWDISTSTQVPNNTSDHLVRASDRSSDNPNASHAIGSWRIQEDGWVVARDGRLLIWIPEQLRSSATWPCNPLVLSSTGTLQLPIDSLLEGKPWQALCQYQWT